MSEAPIEFVPEHSSAAPLREQEYRQLVASDRRRVLLDVLAELPRVVTVGTVAMALADREAEAGMDPEPIERIELTLHHNHLPRMADLGIIDYDPATHRLEAPTDRLPR